MKHDSRSLGLDDVPNNNNNKKERVEYTYINNIIYYASLNIKSNKNANYSMLSTVHQIPKELAFNVWRVNKTHNYVINGMEEMFIFNIIWDNFKTCFVYVDVKENMLNYAKCLNLLFLIIFNFYGLTNRIFF